MLKTNSHLLAALVVVILLGSAGTALAGPPLICHPFQTGNASLLPWAAGTSWNLPDPSYDKRRLVADTQKLLAIDAPVLARMENLRRATIYAMTDPALAEQLLRAVMDRALTGGQQSSAWFDAGYIVEAYKQAVPIRATASRSAWAAIDETTARVDGYNFVTKALSMAPSPEMEFAAALMTQGATSAAHRARATAAATRGSLLEKNLALY